jgi:hypothetical protein
MEGRSTTAAALRDIQRAESTSWIFSAIAASVGIAVLAMDIIIRSAY